MDDLHHNFPRGKTSSSNSHDNIVVDKQTKTTPTTTATKASSSSSSSSLKDNNKEKKKRSSPNDNTSSTNKDHHDILFGKEDVIQKMTKQKQKQKDENSKSSSSSSKRRKVSSLTNSSSSITTTSHSLLPIGGGGCSTTTTKGGIASASTSTAVGKIDYINTDTALVVGCQLLGIVHNITTIMNNNTNTTKNVIITFSLPNGWMGYMMMNSNTNNATTNNTILQLQKYQVVPVIIKQMKQEMKMGGKVRRRIEVSCYPKDINISLPNLLAISSNSNNNNANTKIYGIIQSFEDYGIMLDIGYNNTNNNNSKSSKIRGFVLYTDIDIPYEIIHTNNDNNNNDQNDNHSATNTTSTTTSSTNRVKKVLQLRLYHLIECIVKPTTTSDDITTITNTGIVPLCIPKNIYEVPYTFSSNTSSSNNTNNRNNNNTTLSSSLSSSIDNRNILLFRPGTLLHNVIVETTMINGIAICFGPQSIFRGSIDISHLPGIYNTTTTTTTTTSTTTTSNSNNNSNWQDYYLIHHRILPLVRIIAYEPKTKLLRCSLLPHLLYYQNHISLNVVEDDDVSLSTSSLSKPTKAICSYNNMLMNITESKPTSSSSSSSLVSAATDLNNNSVFFSNDDTIPTIGTIITNCTIVRVDPGIGVVLALPKQYNKKIDDINSSMDGLLQDNATTTSNNKSKKKDTKKELSKIEIEHIEACKVRYVYVPISKAIDDDDDNNTSGSKNGKKSGTTTVKVRDNSVLMKQYGINTNHTVRILSNGYNDSEYLIEHMIVGATSAKYVQAHVLSHYDLNVGQVYKQVPILSHVPSSNNINHNETSIMIDFGLGVHGLIPSIHLLDNTERDSNNTRTKTSIFDRKYKIGTKIDVRVLSIDRDNKKCICTCQKPFVKASIDQMIVSYNDQNLQIGNVVYGYISKIDIKNGIYITFCNNIYGRVSMKCIYNELGISSFDEMNAIYHRGNVVLCRIVHIKEQPKGGGRKKGIFWNHDDDDDEMDVETVNDGKEKNPDNTYREITLSLRIDDPMDVENNIHTTSTTNDTEKNTLTKSNVPIDPSTKVLLTAGALLPLNSLRVMELHPGRITTITMTTKSNNNNTTFVPGYAIVSIKAKYILQDQQHQSLLDQVPEFIECKLPYDQLLDTYAPEFIQSVKTMDMLAESILTIGKKINQKGLLLQDPKKSIIEYMNGTGQLIVLTIRPQLIALMEQKQKKGSKGMDIEKEKNDKDKEDLGNDDDTSKDIVLPNPYSHFYVGAMVMGYVVTLDVRHGAFVRFLDGMTGLVPKTKHGLQLHLYHTVIVKVIAVDDKFNPPKILLGLTNHSNSHDDLNDIDNKTKKKGQRNIPVRPPINPGDVISGAIISKLDFHRATIDILDDHLKELDESTKVQLHVTMVNHKATSNSSSKKKKPKKNSVVSTDTTEQVITSHHPFYQWKVGDELSNLNVLSVELRGKFWIVELTNRSDMKSTTFMEKIENLNPGDHVTGIISGISKQKGLWMELSPTVSAHVPALELSEDSDILNNMERHFPIGSRLACVVMDKSTWETQRNKYCKVQKKKQKSDDVKSNIPFLSLLQCTESSDSTIQKPEPGELVVGRIDRSLPSLAAPDVMIDLRGGYIGRCCITELRDPDDWTNFPLGRPRMSKSPKNADPEVDITETNDSDRVESETALIPSGKDTISHGTFVQCRVLNVVPSKPIVEVSLRPSRLEGDLEDDIAPEVGDSVQAYVVETSKKGCFLRLGRHIEGRTILKELCDGFLPDPLASFPMGRLVVGKVKDIREGRQVNGSATMQADIDMRESILVDEAQGKIKFEDLEIGNKYKASVMRIEEYGVFVRLENSDVSGLVHKSECSDKFIKNLTDLYDPGDLVKVVLLKKDVEKKQVGFGMKPSYFAEDEDSDDDESEDAGDDEVEEDAPMLLEDDIASDDENYMEKLAAKINSENDLDEGSNDHDSDSDDSENIDNDDDDEEESEESDDDDIDDENNVPALDTNVGFDWSGGNKKSQISKNVSEDESGDSSEDDDDENADSKPKSNKARQKQKLRQLEEKEISRREIALADGTVDDNPESAADFERMLAGEPNSSELWIRYMAFFLTTANIPAARSVANRAFDRIEFRQEKEKLNVWCALLTLELKYGTDASLQSEIDRACQHNNPKHVYLRVCEIMCKHQITNPSTAATSKTDATFTKMCSKFRSKKTVWISHFSYLLEQGRYDEAQKVIQRALLSLPTYKHVETLSKYATLAFTHGRVTTARTVFDGLLKQHPKRLDLLFVYVDQEIKNGNILVARSLFQRVSSKGKQSSDGGKTSAANDEILSSLKFNDKQMKRLFKKWYTFEEAHGTEATQESVKDAARAYVENSLK